MSKKRSFFNAIAIAACLFVFNAQAGNNTTDDAKKYATELIQKIVTVLNNDGLENDVKESTLSTIFQTHVDTKWMGRFVLGANYRKASKASLEKYYPIYQTYILKTYIPQFKQYSGIKTDILNVVDKGKGHFIIQTLVKDNDPATPNVSVDYRIRKNKKDGSFMVVDIIGEGISLIATQRSDFANVISQKGVEGLAKSLKKKLEEL